MFRQGHPATPHHGVGEGDPAADYQVGGVLWDTPHHEERIDQGQSTPQGGREMGGFWLSDTRHLDPKVPGGEGGVLALRYQTPGPEGDRKGDTAGRSSSPHHREGERWEGSGLAIPDTWTRRYQEGRGGSGFAIPGTWTRR